MQLYIELEEGDKILRDDHSGTFLVNVNGHCFKSLDCKLEDYIAGTKVKVNYMGYSRVFTGKDSARDPFENLPWKKYVPPKATSEAD